MFPRLTFELPILSMDIVATAGGRVSLAIVDPCPVTPDLRLPPFYEQPVRWVRRRRRRRRWPGAAVQVAGGEGGESRRDADCVHLLEALRSRQAGRLARAPL